MLTLQRCRDLTVLVATIIGAVACAGSDASDADPPTVGTTAAATVQVPTDAPASTSPSLTLSSAPASPPTTPAPTYTLPPPVDPLPQPAPPPPDDGTADPLVELGSIAIPAIGVDRTLYEGIRLPTFDLGPGHWPGTAMPGQIGNMVIGGHRTDGRADFADLDQLQPGAEVIVTDPTGTAFVYIVDHVEVTDPFAARIVYQRPERTATLFACHPPGSIAQRIVVHLTLAA